MLQLLSQQLIFWYLLANAFLNAPVSFNALALTLTMHHLASFWLVYNLWALDLEWKFLCIMWSFLVFILPISMSSFDHRTMSACINRAYLFMAWILWHDMDFVVPIELAFQDCLSTEYGMTMVLRCCCLPCLLIVISMWLWGKIYHQNVVLLY